jgi:hypothetical protein
MGSKSHIMINVACNMSYTHSNAIKHTLHYSTPALHLFNINEKNVGVNIDVISDLTISLKLCRQYSVVHLTSINHDV